MKRGDLIAAAGVFLLALLARTLPFTEVVFRPGLVHPYGDGDVLYHLRRIDALVASWPALVDFDFWMAYPDGAYSIWSPLFDYVPATLARLTGAPPEILALFWPAVLGAASATALFFFARRLQGTRAAFVAALVFSLLPGAVLIGALGRVDHHVAEVLFQIVINAYLARCLVGIEQGEPLVRGAAVVLGLLMGAALLTWAGALLFLLVPALVLSLAALLESVAERARSMGRLGLRAFVIAALVALPYALLNTLRGREPFASHFLSLLQPCLCLVLAAGVPLARAARELRGRPPAGIAVRAFGFFALLFALFAVPGIGPGLRAGLAFVTREQSPWLAEIAEFQPLLSGDAAFTMATASVGYTLFLVPLLLLLAVVRWSRGPRPLTGLLLIVWAAHAVSLSFFQIRFVAYAAPIVALAPGWAYALLRSHGHGVASLAGALALGLLAPAATYWAPLLGSGPAHVAYPQMRAEVHGFLTRVGRVTPPAGDATDPGTKGSYCVFAPWDLGHGLLRIAQRPVVANEYGTHLPGGGYDDSLRVYRGARSEADVLAVLDRRGCRYLITQAHVPGASSGAFARHLHEHDGSDTDAGSGAGSLQLVLETADLQIHGHAGYKLFARVPGARIETPAGDTELVLQKTIRSATRTLNYRRRLPPSRSKRETRVAYPGAYEVLRGGQRLGTLRITPNAVARGERVEVPGG